MSVWTFEPATTSYSRRVDHGVYFVVQAIDGSWRAYFVPDQLGRYPTDGEAMQAVEGYLASFP